MTKKDYKATAKAVKTARHRDDELLEYAVIQELCVVFAKDNPRFNEQKFRVACEVEA